MIGCVLEEFVYDYYHNDHRLGTDKGFDGRVVSAQAGIMVCLRQTNYYLTMTTIGAHVHCALVMSRVGSKPEIRYILQKIDDDPVITYQPLVDKICHMIGEDTLSECSETLGPILMNRLFD